MIFEDLGGLEASGRRMHTTLVYIYIYIRYRITTVVVVPVCMRTILPTHT